MMNNNHKNSGCGFSEQLVSYLYNESTAVEKVTFETHLAACPQCADELELFSGLQFSINDWKLKEFAMLKTPSIEIPYLTAENPVDVSQPKVSWLSGLRNFVSQAPRWSLATASFAVLAVCVGIALFAIGSRTPKDIATANKTQTKPAISPTVEKRTTQSNVNEIEKPAPDKQPQPIDAPKPLQPEVAVTDDRKPTNNRAVKISNNQRQPQRTENGRKNNETNIKNKVEPVAPRLVVDEEEDNSLRLAELFDEIDTK